MRPSKFIEFQERRLRRPLTDRELEAVVLAREACTTGKRDTVKAMWLALAAATVAEATVGMDTADGL